jgi:protein-disulfide isomerase
MKHVLLSFALVALLTACVNTEGLSSESSRPPKGNPNAAVIVEEFADLQCPACQGAHLRVAEPLIEQLGDRVRFEFRHFPLRSIHPYAFEAAMAAECAADQGKFWEFVDLVYQNQAELNVEALYAWAEQLGLEADLFQRCLRSDIKEDIVQAEYAEGRDRGVQGTPTFFVNGQPVQSTVEAITAAVAAAEEQFEQRL